MPHHMVFKWIEIELLGWSEFLHPATLSSWMRVQHCVRLKNEIMTKCYFRGRTLVVIIGKFSSKKSFSIKALAGFMTHL